MRYAMAAVFIMGISASIVGCTDAERGRYSSYGEAGEITCYSGGNAIYSGKSTGKVNGNQTLAGFEFVEEGTGNFIRTNADCIVRHPNR